MEIKNKVRKNERGEGCRSAPHGGAVSAPLRARGDRRTEVCACGQRSPVTAPQGGSMLPEATDPG